MNEQYINELAKRVFEENVQRGWWDYMNRDIHQTLMLVVTEIAEATEGVRKDLMDDHLPHRKMEEVELADTAIRLLDLAGRYEWKYQIMACCCVPTTCEWYEDYGAMPRAAKHFAIVECVVDLARGIQRSDTHENIELFYSSVMHTISVFSSEQGFDIQAAIEEKLVYNRNRADHKRENREKEGGKKF